MRLNVLRLLFLSFCAFPFLSMGQTLSDFFVPEDLTPNYVIYEGIDLAHVADGRIFIAERGGKVKVFKNGVVSEVLTVATTTNSEQGLLGLAVHPNFATNGWLYLFYTNAAGTFHNIDRFKISATNQVVTQEHLLTLDPIQGGFHNGGSIVFHNGSLFVSVGDSQRNTDAQDMSTYRGKILRLTETGQPAAGNPFTGSLQAQSTWAIGFRNPWRLNADASSGKLMVIDVGTSWEEINDVTAPDPAKGRNYAWGALGDGKKNNANYIDPVYTYQTGGTEGCAITNGVIFNPANTSYPASVKNKFIYKDWCRNEFRMIDHTTQNPVTQIIETGVDRSVLGLSIGIDGSLYYINYDYREGTLMRLNYEDSFSPVVVNHPVSKAVIERDNAVFSVTASGTAPFSYQWLKNGNTIVGATSDIFKITNTSLTDAANYSVKVTNTFGTVTSNVATLTVTPYNARPNVTILTPTTTRTWSSEDIISFSGQAADDEDGTLAASSMNWEMQLWHKDTETTGHWHPYESFSGVASGFFEINNGGEKSPNIWVKIILKALDKNGNEGRDTIDVYPNKRAVTVNTVPAGLKVTLNDKEAVSPLLGQAVVNIKASLKATSPQVIGSQVYTFSHWVHGGTAEQFFTVGSKDTSFTAVYTATGFVQTPYNLTPALIPGKIEAEEFDRDGANKAYLDKSVGNAGNQFRLEEDVDIENCNEGGYNIGYVDSGEWLAYTVEVEHTGTYNLAIRYATPYNDRFAHLEMDGVNITGAVSLPITGGFQNFQSKNVTGLALKKGIYIMRFQFDANGINLNYLNFTVETITAFDDKEISAITVYPNPVHSGGRVRIGGLAEGNNVSLYNQQGQLLKQETITDGALIVDEKMKSGMYLLEVQTEKGTERVKLLVR